MEVAKPYRAGAAGATPTESADGVARGDGSGIALPPIEQEPEVVIDFDGSSDCNAEIGCGHASCHSPSQDARKPGRPSLGPRIATAVRLPAGLHAALDKAAKERDVSMNWLIGRAVADYLPRLIPPDEIQWTREPSEDGGS